MKHPKIYRWPGPPSSFRDMEPFDCHLNAIQFWRDSMEGDYHIATGWALLPDRDLWTRHSWLVQGEDRGAILETSQPHREYVGIILDGDGDPALEEAQVEELENEIPKAESVKAGVIKDILKKAVAP